MRTQLSADNLSRAFRIAPIVCTEPPTDPTDPGSVIAICMNLRALLHTKRQGFAFTVLRNHRIANGMEVITPLHAGLCPTINDLRTCLYGLGCHMSTHSEWKAYGQIEQENAS